MPVIPDSQRVPWTKIDGGNLKKRLSTCENEAVVMVRLSGLDRNFNPATHMSITIREVQQRVFFALTAAGHLVNSLDIVFVLDPYGHGDKATEKWIATNKDPAVQSLWYNERERPGLFWTSGSDKRFSLKEMLSWKTISTLYVLITDYDSEEKAIWTDSLACHKVIAAHYMGYKYRSGDGRNLCALSPDVYFYYDRSILSKRLASADDVKEQTLYPTNDSKLSKVAVSPATIAPCAEMQDRTIEPVLSTTRLPSRMPSSNPEESLVIIVFDMAAWNFFTQSHHQNIEMMIDTCAKWYLATLTNALYLLERADHQARR